ncbi:HNH endonuclease [Brevibacillus sp. NRS-1366]|uniref:HNH endonuclease n=1 Tax=Brevibacillus sp. NRS-1366 TaxID=3233899 RepID=UPI003D231BE8
MLCVYCGGEKPNEEFTDEHIIPKAIGGNISPVNPFLIRNVCRRCNNLCGVYVDGPFIKSWMTQNSRAEVAMKYIDFSKNPILPLTYMGIMKGISYQNKICEFWMGPTGDTIYHFHEPYPEEPDVGPMVGIPTHARRNQIDHGFAFLFGRSNNPKWHPAIVYSFVENFKHSTLFLGNGPTPKGGRFSDIPAEHQDLHQQLRQLGGKNHEISMGLNMGYGDRFLAKVALGLGSILLSEDFISSDSAILLRKFLWTKGYQERENIPLHGAGFFDHQLEQNTKEFLNWSGGHSLVIMKSGESINLYASFYERQIAVIRISSEPEHWKGRIGDVGLIYVITPGLQKFAGPIPLSSYIAHKIEKDSIHPDLQALEVEMNSFSDLPPFII